jgi:hypothetical protein
MNANIWKLVWVLVATGIVILSCLARFESAMSWFRELASLIIGGVLVSKPGDTSQDVVLRLAASMHPPAALVSQPPPEAPQ